MKINLSEVTSFENLRFLFYYYFFLRLINLSVSFNLYLYALFESQKTFIKIGTKGFYFFLKNSQLRRTKYMFKVSNRSKMPKWETGSKLTMITALFWCIYRNIEHVTHIVFIVDFKHAIVSRFCVCIEERKTNRIYFHWKNFFQKRTDILQIFITKI